MFCKLWSHYLVVALLSFPVSGFTQEIIGTNEVVDFDSPEGWAMAFMIASSLNLSQLPPQRRGLGELSFAAEIGSIPRLNTAQQRIGFGGFKQEDLNKSPVFGRARIGVGLLWDVTAELSWTPPLELDGAKPRGSGLWGVAFSRPLLETSVINIGLRVFALDGEVQADVTCSAEVAAQPGGSVDNPLSCRAPSKDRLQMDHYGAELLLSFNGLPFGLEPWISLATTRTDPFTEVNALVFNAIDYSTIDTKGAVDTYSAGVSFSVIENWKVNVATSYSPLDVERPNGRSGAREDFWNAKLGLTWDF